MTSNHVLMLTSMWPPVSMAGTHRPLRLAQRLPALGWKTTVLTPTVTRSPYESSMPLDFDLPVPADVQVLRPATPMPAWRTRRRLAQAAELMGQLRNFQRVASRLSWQPIFFPEWTRGALKTAREAHMRDPFSVVWATGNPWGIFLTARKIARALNLPLVLDYRDPWTANPDRPKLSGLRNRYQRHLEGKCIRSARGISYVHPRCLDENKAIFERPANAIWRVIYNGFVEEAAQHSICGDEEPTVIHGGHCYAGRSAVPVLETMRAMAVKDRPRVRFFGNLDAQAERWLGKEHSPLHFEHHGLVSTDEIKAHMRGSAAQLLLVGPEHAHAVPSKIFDYMKSGRPVIGIGPEHAEVRTIIEECGIGVWCTPENRAGIASALRSAKAGTLPYAPQLSKIERFSADNMAIDTAKLLNDVCG